jgi:hypothetical protein
MSYRAEYLGGKPLDDLATLSMGNFWQETWGNTQRQTTLTKWYQITDTLHPKT